MNKKNIIIICSIIVIIIISIVILFSISKSKDGTTKENVKIIQYGENLEETKSVEIKINNK